MRIQLNHVDITALSNPEINEEHVPKALKEARKEVSDLYLILGEMDEDAPEVEGIVEDIAFIEGLPGYTKENEKSFSFPY